ncbi:MAG: hypothetical protein ABFS32_17155 [Bacteroidota bacterium]
MDLVPYFKSSTGLNTKVDPTRIGYDPETGVSDLALAVNITHDDTGRPYRRNGYELLQTGSYHSLFCDGGDCFVGIGKGLWQVGTDYSLTGVRGDLSGSRIGFLQRGSETYYCNDFQNGVIKNGQSFNWPTGIHEGPETTRQFSEAPIGRHIAFFNGRWYISQGNTVWISEPFAPGLFDMARGFLQFKSAIRMIKPVKEGIFISDSKAIWFFRGTDPSEFSQKQLTAYPVLEWSDAIDYIEGYEIGLETPGLCALWGTVEGAMIGTTDGRVVTLTKDKIQYPKIGSQGSGLLRGNRFIHSMFF